MTFPHWYVNVCCWSGLLVGGSAVLAGTAWSFGTACCYAWRVLRVEGVVIAALVKHARDRAARKDERL